MGGTLTGEGESQCTPLCMKPPGVDIIISYQCSDATNNYFVHGFQDTVVLVPCMHRKHEGRKENGGEPAYKNTSLNFQLSFNLTVMYGGR